MVPVLPLFLNNIHIVWVDWSLVVLFTSSTWGWAFIIFWHPVHCWSTCNIPFPSRFSRFLSIFFKVCWRMDCKALHSTIFYIYRPCFGFTKILKWINLRHLWNLGNLRRPILTCHFQIFIFIFVRFCHFYIMFAHYSFFLIRFCKPEHVLETLTLSHSVWDPVH